MQAKPWQIAVIVLAAVVLVASIVYQLGGSTGKVELSTELPFIDVETGQTYIVSRGKDQSLPVPFTLPGDNKATLWPARSENGGWVIPPKYLQLIDKDQGAALDRSNGSVKAIEGKPIKIKA